MAIDVNLLYDESFMSEYIMHTNQLSLKDTLSMKGSLYDESIATITVCVNALCKLIVSYK